MKKEKLIKCFEDTIEFSKSKKLIEKTNKAIASNKIYFENSSCNPQRVKSGLFDRNIIVEQNTTFNAAKKYTHLGRVAVLNFANPVNPGGGVQNGAMAQEECLCRSSNLYLCLCADNVRDDYYSYHSKKGNQFWSDRLIYTRDVTVFKDDKDIPKLLPKKEWFDVDVITCAAPYLAKRKYTNLTALSQLFESRIKNIFEAAIDNNVDVLILGAFGCGAFKNPPEIVSDAFYEIIYTNCYYEKFKKIIFAIKPTSENCPNYRAFDDSLIHFAECHILFSYFERRYKKIPEYINNIIIKNNDYERWIEFNNKYFGKQVSILGDSISTLDGYNPRGYNVFYKENNCEKSAVREISDTWWGKVIDFFGGELLVNNSWSGSRVTKLPIKDSLFPSGCSDERTSALHINNVKPDVIIVYLGTNDWANGIPTLEYWENSGDYENWLGTMLLPNEECFDVAYEQMLTKLKANYPNAEIWCCTLCETHISKRPDFQFPHKYAGTHIEEYNEIIRDVVRRNGCRLIDLYDYKMTYDSIDGSHPTNAGMNTIATMVIRSIAGFDVDQFLDCEDGQHEYKVVEEYTGGTRYICSRCGKTEHKSNLPPIECQEDQHEYEMCGQDGHGDYYRCRRCGKEKFVCPWEVLTVEQDKNINNENEYVMLDPNITTVLYSDILRLTIMSSGKIVQFQKDVVEVGRDKICDLLLEGKSTVARRQATFLYEKDMWFLRDNFSTNGTWLNGAKIQPGKKYQLATNDEINFAMAERIIFDKHDYNAQPVGDPDAKALAFLEAGMATFAKSDHKDEVSLKLIIAALSDAPLYFPVEIDLEAMLGSVDPTKLKAGDTLQPSKDVKMRILTLTPESGVEFVPMFTSNEEVNKGPSASIIRFYPQDYLPKLVQMDKPVIINPFSENRFLLSKQLITELLLPLVENKTKPQSDVVEQPADKYIGKTVDGKYEVLKLIGRGGFYTTYLVRNIHVNKAWALKVCDKKNRHYSPAMKENILTEPYMMQKLDHLAIPKVVDIIEDEESLFIVRDYIEGEALETIVKMYGAQPVDKVIEWGKQMCSALGYLHSQNPPLIYRDMKPANVILKPDGAIKFIDFGIMRAYKPNQSSDTCCLGTKGYAAPEQYGGSQTDARTDIFGLGMTMFRLVTGVDPIEPPYEIKPICMINPSLPKGLEYIISKCIQPNPNERYQSCDELMADLNNYLSLPKPKGIFGKLFGKK